MLFAELGQISHHPPISCSCLHPKGNYRVPEKHSTAIDNGNSHKCTVS